MVQLIRAALILLLAGLSISAHALPSCAPMDFDGDCRSDILWRHAATGENSLHLMHSFTITSQASINVVPDPAWQVKGVGDFDGDGRADILWRHAASGENVIYLMNGTAIASQASVNVVADLAWQVKGIGDFDGDGRADILWRHARSGQNQIYLMKGTTIASQASVNIVDDLAWQVKGVGDFDGDGRADILWRHAASGENFIYLMNGTAIASQASVNIVDDLAWQVKGIGDFDGDGRTDILWRHAASGENYIYLMNGTAIASHASVNIVDDLAWQVKGIGDFDGDGRADILWRHAASGENYIYLMNGTAIASQAAVETLSDLHWMPRSAPTLADTPYPRTPIVLPGTFAAEDFDYGGEGVGYHDKTKGNNHALYRANEDVDVAASTDALGGGYVVRHFQTGEWLAYTVHVATSREYDVELRVSSTSSTSAFHIEIDGVDVTGRIDVPNTGAWNAFQWVGKKGVALGAGQHVLKIVSDQQAFDLNSIRVSAALPPDTAAPSTPAGLAVSAVTASSLILSWSPATDNVAVTGYRIIRNGSLLSTLGNVTTFQDTSLNPATTYTYSVRAFDAAGNVSARSALLPVTTSPASDTAAPSTPAGLAASAVTASSLTLSWSPATDNVAVTGYRVFRNGTLVASPAGTSALINGLAPSTSYSFTVAAVDAAGNVSALSASFPVTTSPAPDTVAPSTPTGFAASAVGITSIILSWSPATDNVAVTGYRVYRDGALAASTASNSVLISGLAPSTSYSFAVAAVDAAGNVSALSAPLPLTTAPSPDTAAPSTPAGLAASAVTVSSLTLSWSPATDNVAVTGYRVFRNGTLVASPTGTSALINGLAPSTSYSFTVSAVDASGNVSALSAPLPVTTLPASDTAAPSTPAGLAASAVTASSLTLSWSPATDNVAVTGYRVFRNGTLVASPAGTSALINGLAPSTSYSFSVSAVDAAGNVSALSASFPVTTSPAPDTVAPSTPTGFVATAVSASRVNLSWSASTDNVAVTGYQVIRNGSLLTTLGNVTTFQDTGLNAATTYTYRMRALDAAGNVSPQSNAASATTQAAPDSMAPTPPTGLAATVISSSKIGLSWTASTDNVAVTGYRIYRNGVLLATLGGNVNTYQSAGLAASTAYTYQVDAVDAVGNASGKSVAASATTLAPNTTSLAWDAVTHPSLAGYRVYYGTAPGVYLQSAGQGVNVGNVTTYTVTGLASGTRYYFATKAVNTSNNESPFSNEVFKDIP